MSHLSGLTSFKLRSKSEQKPLQAPAPKALPIPDAPPMDAKPGQHTLRDIADLGGPSDTFYLAANQSLVNSLKHQEKDGSTHWHTYYFKNMVATIILETARRAPGPGHEESHRRRLSWPIPLFNTLRKRTQQIILGNLWEDCYRRETPSTPAENMKEGEAGVEGGKGLPSSIRRIDGGGFFARIQAGPVPRAWEKWRVGFRVDGGKGVGGSNRDDLKRITTEGSRPLQKLPDLAVMCVQKYYHEHDCSKSSDLYIGYQNRDLYNESGTCVSRSLFGATAFPYRDTQNNTPGLAPHLSGNLQFQYLFAIDCDGARGLDTEQVQVDMGNASLWRPGEKAFAGFGPERVLGWTRIVKMGQPSSNSPMATGWSFKFVDSQWAWVKKPEQELATYLEAELATWKPGVQYNIASTYDFQNKPPPPNV